MRGVAKFVGLALAVGLLVTSTASAAISVTDATDRLDSEITSSSDALDVLIPGPVGSSADTALNAQLPGSGDRLSVDEGLLAEAPSVSTATLDLPSQLDRQAPTPSSGYGTYEAAADASGQIQPATLSTSQDDLQLPDYVTGDGEASSEDDSSTATTQSSEHSSADTSSSAEEAWQNLSETEKAAVAAGALGLLVFGPLTLYSRIQRDDALENDTRREIYEIVETTPGICIQDVADEADVSYSTASYHLKRLVRMDYVTRKEDGNKVLYYKNGGTFTQEERDLIPILQNEEAMDVFQHIVENPWCYRAQVAEALDVSHTTVNWHLDRLQDHDLVEEHREGRSCHLHVGEEALDRVVGVMDKLEETSQTDQAARPKVAAAA